MARQKDEHYEERLADFLEGARDAKVQGRILIAEIKQRTRDAPERMIVENLCSIAFELYQALEKKGSPERAERLRATYEQMLGVDLDEYRRDPRRVLDRLYLLV